jgi:cell division septum initiation protein DivIVA
MEDAGPAGAPDAPRLSPGEIAYHDFARAADGVDEQEVRAFLGEVADALAAARDRALRLEERVVELQAELDEARGSSSRAGSGTGDPLNPRAEALFARLREDGEESTREPTPKSTKPKKPAAKKSKPKQRASKEQGAPAEQPAVEAVEPAADDTDADDAAVPAPEPTPDDAIRGRRSDLLDPLTADLVRAAKRVLQDEQNELLDAARRAKARVEPDRLLPEPAAHRDVWVAVLAPAVDAAYTGGRREVGRSGKSVHAPERVVSDLAATLVTPLRERLATTLAGVVAQGPYESSAELHRELASAVGARDREWRAADLEARLGDTLAAAYARGAFDGAPSGAHLRWVTDAGQRCPDCEDNSLEPTVKGQSFPTGQPHPPAHPGCRCLVVVVDS